MTEWISLPPRKTFADHKSFAATNNRAHCNGQIVLTPIEVLVVGALSLAIGFLAAIPIGLMTGMTIHRYGHSLQITIGLTAGFVTWSLTTLCVAVLLLKLIKAV